MEQIIKDYKKVYLQTPIPMGIDEGLMEVLGRIENTPSRPFYYSRIFMTVAVLLLFMTGAASAVFFAPPTSSLHAVKVAAQKFVGNVLPTPTPFELETPGTPKKAEPTTTPTNTPSPTPEKNNQQQNGQNNSNRPNPARSVKGIQNFMLPTVVPQKVNPPVIQGTNPSSERKNENSSQGNANSQEKSNNGKKN